jgi:hypothetical protein
MSDPCDKGPEIKKLQEEQSAQSKLLASHDHKLDQVLENQQLLGKTMTQALNRLTSMIEADIGTRKDVEQGKKDVERLYDKARDIAERVDVIEIRNARCDGAGIFDEWPSIRKFVNQQKGLQRFIPTTAALISTFLAILIALDKLFP